MVQKTVAPLSSLNSSSIFCNGWKSLMKAMLRSLKSMQMHSFPSLFFFWVTTIGETHGDAPMHSIMPFSCRSSSSSVIACLSENGRLLSICWTSTESGLGQNPFVHKSCTWISGAACGLVLGTVCAPCTEGESLELAAVTSLVPSIHMCNATNKSSPNRAIPDFTATN